jgi:hypothetical protein
MYRIAFSWIVATLSQLNCPAVATLSQLNCPACRNSIAQLSQLNCPAIAQPLPSELPSELPSCRNSIAQLSQLCATRCPPGAQQIAQPEVHCPTVVWSVACLTDFFSIWATAEYDCPPNCPANCPTVARSLPTRLTRSLPSLSQLRLVTALILDPRI